MIYIGGVDYSEFSQELELNPNDTSRCVGIVILEDTQQEDDESFEVVIEGLGVSTVVTILDDDDGKHCGPTLGRVPCN